MNGITVSDDSEIAYAFNDCFCNIGEALSQNFSGMQSDPARSLATRTSLFFFEPVSYTTLISIVQNMKNTGQGCDNLSMFISERRRDTRREASRRST